MARVVGKGNADGLMEGGNSGNSPPSPTQTVTQINHLVCPLLYTIYGGRIANLIKTQISSLAWQLFINFLILSF